MTVLNRGSQAIRDKQEALDNRNNNNFNWFKLEPGQSATVRFLTPMHSILSYDSHYIPAKNTSFPCLRDECPACEAGNRKSWRGMIGLFNHSAKENQTQVWGAGITVFSTLLKFDEKYAKKGGLQGRTFEVRREGTGRSTVWHVMPDDAEPMTEEERDAARSLPDLELVVKVLDRVEIQKLLNGSPREESPELVDEEDFSVEPY